MNDHDTIAVLLVEDDSEDYLLIAKQLRDQHRGVVIDWADSVSAALQKLETGLFDVILTDLSLPDSTSLSTVFKLKTKAKSLPIIVLTSLDDECMEQDLLEAGAQDYLVKGELNGRAMFRAILHAVQRQKMQNQVDYLLTEREHDQLVLQQQAALLKKKNRRLNCLYKTAQEFVDNVSHDFRTPLTVIKDFVSVIREGMVGDISDEQRTLLDKISVRADDLNYMVDDLLDTSKLEAGLLGAWRRNVAVSTVLEQAEAMLRQRAKVRNVDLSIAYDPNIPEVYCDAAMIGRVITNLAVNAIKFSGDGGQVQLWAQADPAGHQVVIGVSDNGPGIDSESLSKIFERFRQLDNSMKSPIKGFGLGLNIAQQLCRINLGELSVKSRVGDGSTFSFTIPVADPPEVLSRWLKTQNSCNEYLHLFDISILSDGNSANANEFDSFLNCLLRKHDLLFRISECRWLLIIATSPSESDRWLQRAQEEFQRHNRNRPTGPLPEFSIETHGTWRSVEQRDAVLHEFNHVFREAEAATFAG